MLRDEKDGSNVNGDSFVVLVCTSNVGNRSRVVNIRPGSRDRIIDDNVVAVFTLSGCVWELLAFFSFRLVLPLI
jgi:hypothetical protein